MSTVSAPQIGDVFVRVDGTMIDDGSESYQGMELTWQSWRVTKVTPCGAWLESVEWPYKKKRFALNSGAKWISRTRSEALKRLIARKRRHLQILDQQMVCARETLDLAAHSEDL